MNDDSRSPARLGFVGHINDNKFLKDIMRALSATHEVRLADYFDDDAVRRMVAASDVIWVEWGTDLAAKIATLAPDKRKILRIHSFEAFTSYPATIPFERYSDVIFVSEYIRSLVAQQVPDMEDRTRTHIVRNGVDLSRFSLKTGNNPFDIAFVAMFRHVKNIPLLLQCFAALHARDPRYKLHIAGDFIGAEVDVNELGRYLSHIIEAMGLAGSIIFYGRIDDVHAWLADKNWIVSTSMREAHPLNLVEGMAVGLRPVVHNYPAAREVFDAEYVFNTVDQFVEMVLTSECRPERYREFVECNFPLDGQMEHIARILALGWDAGSGAARGAARSAAPSADGRREERGAAGAPAPGLVDADAPENRRVRSLLNLAEHYRRRGEEAKSEEYLAQARALMGKGPLS
ncbi:MAG: glycosyltransferase family 4 protein [Desulfovibrionaceae bacterium]|jgi:glycosyltransferase involved in cell wall biosynthesis|nr:glycosyltransferase family 4 protein [Desulfovibrionaceae bacterium]